MMGHKMSNFKTGDKVVTVAGNRINGKPGIMEVVQTGKRWSDYAAVTCLKQNGKITLFLEKNLRKVI